MRASISLPAVCFAGMVFAMPVVGLAEPEQEHRYGSYLADRFGSTCLGFVNAADASDGVRLQPYTNMIKRLIAEKWGMLPDDKVSRVVLNIVTQCEAQGRSDFESTAKRVISRSVP